MYITSGCTTMIKKLMMMFDVKMFWQWAILFLIPACVIIGVGTYYYSAEKEKEKITVSAHERAVIKIGKASLERSINTFKSDLMYLAHNYDFNLFLNAHSHFNGYHFTDDFIQVMKSRGVYEQIRWIDTTGMERVKIEDVNGTPILFRDDQLEYRGDHYDVVEAMNLPVGSVYLSPLDLKMNHNQIVRPYKPLLRLALTIQDKYGHKRGILMLNYLGNEILGKFKHYTESSFGDVMLLNSDGYWLKGSPKDEWGFVFNRADLTLAKRSPKVWKKIVAADEGQFYTDEGLWSFQTVFPLDGINDNFWKIVTFIPNNKLYLHREQSIGFILFVGFISLLMGGVGSFALVTVYRKKKETVKELRKLQSKTEGILSSIPDIIMQIDQDKRYTWANKRGLDFFGEDVVGKEASEYFEGEQNTYELIHPMMTGEMEAVYVESWQRRRDGEKRLLGWWCHNLKDSEGNITGALSTARDITEEYKRDESLLFQASIFDAVQDSIIVHDLVGRFIYLNENAWKTRGYTHDEMMKLSLKDIDAPEYPGVQPVNLKAALREIEEKGSITLEVEHLRKDGTRFPVEVFARFIVLEGKKCILSSVRDITERKHAQSEIELLSKAVEQVDDIVFITDRFGNITYSNASYTRQTGYSREEAIGKNARLSKSGKYDQQFYKDLWETILSGKVYRNTLINRKRNGSLYYEKKTITPLFDSMNEIIGFISTGKDVTVEELHNQEIERVATIDKLTGIYNRHKFEELFELESERSRRFGEPLSLILIDIDHFKSVNDTYGHDIGDEVLKGLSLVVQTNIRKIDIFARWGGEEFLVLSPNSNIESIQVLAEKLRKEVEEAKFPEVGKITVSLGISVFDAKESFSALFKRADEGLYYAKEHGRNQVKVML